MLHSLYTKTIKKFVSIYIIIIASCSTFWVFRCFHFIRSFSNKVLFIKSKKIKKKRIKIKIKYTRIARIETKHIFQNALFNKDLHICTIFGTMIIYVSFNNISKQMRHKKLPSIVICYSMG